MIETILSFATAIGLLAIGGVGMCLIAVLLKVLDWFAFKRGPKQVDDLSYKVMKLRADVGYLRERVYKLDCKEITEFNKKKGKRWV